jgi:K+-transporting ATPase KdpF subunit
MLFCLRSASVSLPPPSSMSSPVKECERAMLLDYVLGSIVTIVIMVYLVYALINPERF